jgi:hypothetical protein
LKKLSRREFLKCLTIISAISIVGLDVVLLKANISKFSKKELENIKKIRNIELQEYLPYLTTTDPFEYVITLDDGTKEYYTDIRCLEKKYGKIIDYWNRCTGDDLPDNIKSNRYDSNGWLL